MNRDGQLLWKIVILFLIFVLGMLIGYGIKLCDMVIREVPLYHLAN